MNKSKNFNGSGLKIIKITLLRYYEIFYLLIFNLFCKRKFAVSIWISVLFRPLRLSKKYKQHFIGKINKFWRCEHGHFLEVINFV